MGTSLGFPGPSPGCGTEPGLQELLWVETPRFEQNLLLGESGRGVRRWGYPEHPREGSPCVPAAGAELAPSEPPLILLL